MKRKKNSNVINLIKDSKMNVAIIVFAAILLYVAISVVISMNKEPIATYKVGDSDISDNICVTGLAVRNEITVKATRSGYITYFTRNNDKVRKGSAVCTIDDTGNIISNSESPEAEGIVLTQKDYQEIRKTISLYKTNYEDISFYKVYNFKDEISSQILDVANQVLVDKLHSNKTAGNSFQYMYSPVSGILCFYTDGYEDKKVENIKSSDFDAASYVKNSFASGDIVNSNSVVYKMIEDEKWNIVCKLSAAEAEKLKEEEYLEININNSNFNLYVNFDIIQKQDGYYLNIFMKKYMSTFANERFLNVEILLDSYEGLKIPNSSIVRKKVYLLPKEYAAAGGNASTKNKVYRQAVDDEGNPTIEQITLDIYDERDGYLLVNPDTFQPTDVLIQLDTNNKLNVSLLASDDIEGVYLANEGVAQFIEVKVERPGDEFTVVSTGGSLRKYDNIIMDSSKVSENQTIY